MENKTKNIIIIVLSILLFFSVMLNVINMRPNMIHNDRMMNNRMDQRDFSNRMNDSNRPDNKNNIQSDDNQKNLPEKPSEDSMQNE